MGFAFTGLIILILAIIIVIAAIKIKRDRDLGKPKDIPEEPDRNENML